MGMREFDPIGIKSIEVRFNCNICGHEVVSEEIGVPLPDYSAENHSDSVRDNDGYAICPNCDEEYEINVYVGFGGGHIDIDDIKDDDIYEIIEHEEEYDVDYELYPQKLKKGIKPAYTGFRLISLEVNDWYVLKNFKIEFEEGINVLIGDNGSGKSSVIECIALIFGHLHKFFNEDDRKAPHMKGYMISFKSQEPETEKWHTVQIDNLKDTGEEFNPTIYIDEKILDVKSCKNIIINLLPTKIGLYYAGVTDRLKELSIHFEEKYSKKIRLNEPAKLYPLTLPVTRPFLYVNKGHLGIMLLCLLVSDDEKIRKCWGEEIGIDLSTSEIILTLKKPSWAKDSVEQLWGAHDLARQFITLLSENTNSKRVSDQKIEIAHNGLYLKDEFARMFKNNIESNVFDIFDFLLFSDLLDSIDISWKNNEGEHIELDHLSEGEKQLITTMAYRLLWMNQKGILLFDEPDTYLHPNWQVSFMKNLIHQSIYNQYIISTHSPQLINNNFKGGLFIIKRGILIDHSNNFYGRDINSILTHYMGAQNRPAEISIMMDKIATEIANKKYNIAISELNMLKELISENDSEFIRLSTKLKFLLG